jgi:hypothetical protein
MIFFFAAEPGLGVEVAIDALQRFSWASKRKPNPIVVRGAEGSGRAQQRRERPPQRNAPLSYALSTDHTGTFKHSCVHRHP